MIQNNTTSNTNNNLNRPKQDEYADLFEIFFKYFRFWPWIAASMALALIVGYFYLQTQCPRYKFSSSILVLDGKKGGNMDALSVLKDLGMGTNGSAVENEVEVIHSSLLVQDVVNRLGLHTSYSKKVFLNRDEELYTASPIQVSLYEADLNNLKEAVGMVITPESGGVLLEGTYQEQPFSVKVDRLPNQVKLPFGRVVVRQRDGMALPDYSIEVTIVSPKVRAKQISQVLQAEAGKKNQLITLSLEDANRQRGQDILNTLVEVYNLDAMVQINRSAVNTANFIDDRLKLLTGDLSQVERKVEDYKQANKLTDLSSEAKIYLEQNSAYEQKRSEVETQLNLVKYVEEFIKNPANRNALFPNLGLDDAGLAAVMSGYNELILKRERIVRSSSEENPALKEVSAQLFSARLAIENSIANSRKALLIARSDLEKQDNLMVSRIHQVPRQEREFIEIKRQQEIKANLYVFLLQKREEAALTMAVTVPKARMIEVADDGVQTAPKKPMILMIFLMIGLMIPIAVIYLRDLFNTSFAGRAEVEKMITVPVLSELGHNEEGEIILNHASQIDSNAELFRLLRTKLQLVLDHPREKVILVTSTVPGEGKTYVSLNAAISLSLSEKKVLLIGLDLRKPKLASHFGLESNIGVTAYLSGMEPDYRKLIFSLKDYPHLDVLPAGAIPPNPSELILRDRMDALIEDAKKHYDYIVLDTAPVGAVSDTLLLNRISDLNIYVCRANYSHKQNLNLANRIQQEQSLTPLYLLVNDVDHESGQYYYGGSYHYGYGYGYGYSHQKDQQNAKKKKGVDGLKKKLMEIGKN